MKAILQFTLLTLFACLTSHLAEAQRSHLFPKKASLHSTTTHVQLKTPASQDQVAERGGPDLRIIGERYDEWENNSWAGYDSSVYTYTNNRLTETLSRNFNGTIWQLGERSQYEYDANGNQIKFLDQAWNGSQWDNTYQILSTYNAANQEISETHQLWSTNVWENSNHYIYSYDANGNRILETYQYWDGSNWLNGGRYTSQYDVNGKLILYTTQYWDGFAWNNSYREMYEYDATGKLIVVTVEDWDGIAWEDSYRDTYTYNSGNRVISVLYQEWSGAAWENSSQDILEYDSNDKWVHYLYQSWDAGNWQNYINVIIDEAAFYPEIDPIFGSLFNSYLLQFWDDSSGTWVNSERYFGYFETFVGVKDIAKTFDCQVYPNPSNGNITLYAPEADIQPERMVLCDMNGRQLIIRRLQGIEHEQIHLGQLPKGHYLLRVLDKRGREAIVPVQIVPK